MTKSTLALTFNADALRDLTAEWELRFTAGIQPRSLYGEATGPGFWLVGDDGVYLMPNWVLQADEKPPVVYANECNPDKMPAERWIAVKNATFGGDDGVEFIGFDSMAQYVRLSEDHLIVAFPGEGMLIAADCKRGRLRPQSLN